MILLWGYTAPRILFLLGAPLWTCWVFLRLPKWTCWVRPNLLTRVVSDVARWCREVRTHSPSRDGCRPSRMYIPLYNWIGSIRIGLGTSLGLAHILFFKWVETTQQIMPVQDSNSSVSTSGGFPRNDLTSQMHVVLQ